MRRRLQLLLLFLMVFLSGCQGAASRADPSAAPSLEPPKVVIESLSPVPSITPTFIPSETFTPTSIPTPTAVASPMSIEVMRRASYPGSDIRIEMELVPGGNYRRYYASYLSDDQKIYGLLTIPEGEMPPGGWPAVVFNHGYVAPQDYRTTVGYEAHIDHLASAGYIVFKIDYRGNAGSTGLGLGAYGDPGYTVDVLNAVASLQRFPQANPQKIGMWGHSMGGFLVLRAMVISHAIKAGVIWAGVVMSYADMLCCWNDVDPTPVPGPDTAGWRFEWLRQYGPPEEDPQYWDSISANTYLADLSGPLQLHQGTADTEVSVSFAEKLAQDIQAAGKSVELYTYPGDNHDLSKSFDLAMSRTIQFFDTYLKK
jgi:dipeptidyl aminopeptidase/acylaminoacyl peptidase